ncbi:MAG: aspartate racemase [Bradymonadia bacterium]|jgi:aspartate racemase
MKRVGVIGGLGPGATVDFFAKIVARTGAKTDQDNLQILIDNNPHFPDRNRALAGTGPSPGPALAASAAGLERAGADFVVMVCNTAHAWQAEIEAALTVPFLSIVDLTVAATPGKCIGLLATSGCISAGLYQRAFAPRAVRVGDVDAFMALVYRIKTGDVGPAVRAQMRHIAMQLVDDGADVFVAGCTEIALALDAADLPVPFISSTDVLVDATIRYAKAVNPAPAPSPAST